MMTKLLDLTDKLKYTEYINEAKAALKFGKIVAFPTETVYGLGVNANDAQAVSHLFQTKQRPEEKKLTVLIAEKSNINWYDVEITPHIQKLIDTFWPGPLTLVIPKKDGDDIGLRVPNHKIAVDLIKDCGFPVVAPSANISGQPALTNAKDVYTAFKNRVDIVLDYGNSDIGTASTVVRVNNKNSIEILRHGAISDNEIYRCLDLKHS